MYDTTKYKLSCASLLLALVIYVSIINLSKENGARRRLTEYSELANKLELKPFESWNRENSFCVPNTSPDTTGIFYIKVPKTSSGTLASITERLAAREARRRHFKVGEFCKVHEPAVHHPASMLKIADRVKSQSFLYTVIRHPDTRAISHYGMHITFGNWSATDNEFVEKLQGNVFFRPHTQLWWIASKFFKDDTEDDTLPDIVQDVLNQYNFIGIYERLHESIVVLSMLTGANLHDVLINFRPLKIARCGSLVEPKWLTDNMKSHIESDEWKNKQKGDFLLYEAVNKELDLTIERLGRDKVAKELEKYEKLLEIGTRLSSELFSPGCGVLFNSPMHDIDELRNFNDLSEEEKQFVVGTKEKFP